MSMTWNWRIIQCDNPESAEPNTLILGEAYYNKDRKAWGVCTSKGPTGDSLEEVREAYEQMAEAFKAPILKMSELATEEAPK